MTRRRLEAAFPAGRGMSAVPLFTTELAVMKRSQASPTVPPTVTTSPGETGESVTTLRPE